MIDFVDPTPLMCTPQDKENLKMMMNLLRDKSPNIQYEAFHVFKVSLACLFFVYIQRLVVKRHCLVLWAEAHSWYDRFMYRELFLLFSNKINGTKTRKKKVDPFLMGPRSLLFFIYIGFLGCGMLLYTG